MIFLLLLVEKLMLMLLILPSFLQYFLMGDSVLIDVYNFDKSVNGIKKKKEKKKKASPSFKNEIKQEENQEVNK